MMAGNLSIEQRKWLMHPNVLYTYFWPILYYVLLDNSGLLVM